MMRVRKYFAASVAVVVVVACSAVLSPVDAAFKSEVEAEEYAVYSAALDDMFAGRRVTPDIRAGIMTLVIQEHTVRESFRTLAEPNHRGQLRLRVPSVSEATIDDHVAKNKKNSRLKRRFNMKLDYTFIKKNDLDRFFKDDLIRGWEEFDQKFPNSGGFVGLSRVGFNSDKSQALVYVEHGCGIVCGSGNYILLRKGVAGWEVVGKHQPWIS